MGKKMLASVLAAVLLFSLLGFAGLAEETDFNIGYYAEVSVTNKDGAPASAGYNGENHWRTYWNAINDYSIAANQHYWGTNYTFSAERSGGLPVYVDFDYGGKAAAIHQIRLVETLRNFDGKTDLGRYTRVKLYNKVGSEWQVIVPAAAANGEYALMDDNSIALDWSKPSLTENLTVSAWNNDYAKADFIHVPLGEYIVSHDFRIEILEIGEPNGDAWGETGIDEIMMDGHYAADAELTDCAPDFLDGYAKKAVSVMKKMGTAENAEQARTLLKYIADDAEKETLTAQVNKAVLQPWRNLALEASLSGDGSEQLGQLNDENANGLSYWSSDPMGSFTYDYGKTVTVNAIELGGCNADNAPKKVAVYATSGGAETLVGEFDVHIGRVPEHHEFNLETAFGSDAYAEFEKAGQIAQGEVHYSDFYTIVLPNAAVCEKLRVQTTAVRDSGRTGVILTEARTFGTDGANVEYHYNAENMAFRQPVSVIDGQGNPLRMIDPNNPQRSSWDYLTDYNITGDGWYKTALPYDEARIPFYITIDFQGRLVELEKLTLGEGREATGQIKRIEMQVHDGKDWVTVPPSQTQTGGVTADGNQAVLDWNNLSRSESDETKIARFMDVEFDQPQLGYQFRVKVTEASNYWGAILLDEVMAWGWEPMAADLETRDNAAEIKAKKADYLLGYAAEKPTQKNISLLKDAVSGMSGEEKEKYLSASQKIAVRDVISNTTASAGVNPEKAYGLNDGLWADITNYWNSDTTNCDDNLWAQLSFDGLKDVDSIRLSTRYYPCAINSLDVYAQINGTMEKIMDDVPVYQAHTPELGTYFSSTIPFDAEGKKAYADKGLLRSDGLEINCVSWYQIDLPRTVQCTAIKIEIEACGAWGASVSEMEVIGGDPVTDSPSVLSCSAAFSSLEALKAAGAGTVNARISNQRSESRTATVVVFFYQDDKLLSSYCKGAAIQAGTTQDISFAVPHVPQNATKMVYTIWGDWKDTDLRPLMEQVEVI